VRIGEATHDQIHLAHAAPPGAKQNPPPALIERCATKGGAGHQAPFLPPVHAVSIRQQEESFLADRLIQPLEVCGAASARAYIGRNACCQHGRVAKRGRPAPFQIDLLKDGLVMAEQKTDSFLTNRLSAHTVFQNAARMLFQSSTRCAAKRELLLSF
jgi:hypothetical protein